MTITHRLSTTVALIVCLVGTQWGGTLFAHEDEPSASAPQPIVEHSRVTPNDEIRAAFWGSTLKFTPAEAGSFAQRRGYRGRGREGRHGAAQAAIILGAVASITGAALLVYANRPDCNSNRTASGCGYGTKVVGGAVLSAGLVGLVAGAVTWR